jgi:hypothetical protein
MISGDTTLSVSLRICDTGSCHGSSMLNNLVESHVGSNRDAIKADLLGKVVYDDPAVFKRLRVDQVDKDFVARCLASFKTANSKDIDNLVGLVGKASKKTPDDLEMEENEDKAGDTKKEEKSGNHGSAEEKKMYDPLVCNALRDFALLL